MLVATTDRPDHAGRTARASSARAASILAMSIFFIVIIASIARLAALVSGSFIAAVNARGTICQLNPNLLAPAAHAFLAAATDDRIPVAVGFLLRVGEHLERDRLVEGEFGAAVQPDEMLTQNRELHGQHVAGLTAWIVAGRLMYCGDAAVRKSRGIELCGLPAFLSNHRQGAIVILSVMVLILSSCGSGFQFPCYRAGSNSSIGLPSGSSI
jgi:hypothetical protein